MVFCLFVCIAFFFSCGFCLLSQRCFPAPCCWCICLISPREGRWGPMGTRGPEMMAAWCLLQDSCDADARASTAAAGRAREAATRRARPALGEPRWAAASRPGASARPASSFRRRYIPAPRQRRRVAARRLGAGLASGTPGTPTGPGRLEQSAGSPGGDRERRLHRGELGTRGPRGPPPPSRVDRRVMESVFLGEPPQCVLGRLKDIPGCLSGKSFHHLIMQRGDVLVRDAVMNGISNTCVPSIIYLCHPGLGICICNWGLERGEHFSLLGPRGVRERRTEREEPVQLFRVSARLSAAPVAPEGKTDWNRRSAASRSSVLHLRLSPPRGLSEVGGLDVNFCTFCLNR